MRDKLLEDGSALPLSDIEGQTRAVEALRRAARSGRLHHAFLFSGPDGVGKTLTAHALAQALLCTTPTGERDSCGVCNACLRVADRNHADLHVVELEGTAKQITIGQVRGLQRALGFKSFEGHRRVVIIQAAERMNPATANALLKTLEEPGPDTHFVLVTHASHLLLPTIVSRCQRVRFAPLERALVARHLCELADLDPIAAELLAALAEGSIGKGLSLAKSPVLEQRSALLAFADAPRDLLRIPAVLELAEDLARRPDDLPLVLHLLRTWYRDLLLVREGLSDGLVHRDLEARLRERAPSLSREAVMARIDLVNETEAALDRNANTRLSLETLFLQLAA